MKAKEIIKKWAELTEEQKEKVNNRWAFNACTGRFYTGINAFSFGMAGLSGWFVPFHKLYDRVEEDGKKKKKWKYDIKGAKTMPVMFIKTYVDKKTWDSMFGGRGQGRVVSLADIREIEWGETKEDFLTEWVEWAEPEQYDIKKKKDKLVVEKKETPLPYNDV